VPPEGSPFKRTFRVFSGKCAACFSCAAVGVYQSSDVSLPHSSHTLILIHSAWTSALLSALLCCLFCVLLLQLPLRTATSSCPVTPQSCMSRQQGLMTATVCPSRWATPHA
jgi:hypothetical protein